MVKVIDENEFVSMIKQNVQVETPRPLVVDCFTDWCAPCRASAPIFEKLSEKYTDADFVKINVDHNPSVGQMLKVRGVPTFAILRGNKLVSRIVGANMRKVESEIQRAIKS
jgi:thioredoxin 1